MLRPVSATQFPEIGTPEEDIRFKALQAQLRPLFTALMRRPDVVRTIVIVPDWTLDQELLESIEGVQFYEERMLSLLMLLRFSNTTLIYLTSDPVHTSIIEYYLGLLPDSSTNRSRERLVLLSCDASAPRPLAQKILDRPELMGRILENVVDPATAYMVCYNVTGVDRTLSVRLGLPLYGCDPALYHLGDKSHGRDLMRAAGLTCPAGRGHLRSVGELVQALTELRDKDPGLLRAVVKLNEGFSGVGNAIFSYEGAPKDDALKFWIERELPRRLVFEAKGGASWRGFVRKFQAMGGVVEAFIEGEVKRSPTARYRISPLGEVRVVSSQDQILGGPTGQTYLACAFPSSEGYRETIEELGLTVCESLRDRGVLGAVGIDFLCVKRGAGWDIYGIELNIREGGASYPFQMFEALTNGRGDAERARYPTPAEGARCYYASDNLQSELYMGLSPDDLIDIATANDIHFNMTAQEGVVFHLMGALALFGKLGVVCIAQTEAAAEAMYRATVAILDKEAKRRRITGGDLRQCSVIARNST